METSNDAIEDEFNFDPRFMSEYHTPLELSKLANEFADADFDKDLYKKAIVFPF